MASPSRPSIDSSACLSPILSPTASTLDLTTAYPPRSLSARPPKARRTSSASSIVSFSSSIGTALDWRTSKDWAGGGFAGGSATSNAISVLVEAPGSRTAAASRPKPGDIPPVTLTQIQKIQPSAFASYLSIVPEYERYQRAKDRGLEELVRPSKGVSGALAPHPFSSGPRSPVPSITDLTPDDGTSTKSSAVRRRKGSLAVTPLSSVPHVYFDENFHLENPRTFDVVSERSEIIKSTAPNGMEGSVVQSQRKALATNAILQEKLSWYMDTVEVHLISSISTASSSFFAALGDLRELHSEATASVQKIQALRKELVRLDEEQAVKGLEIVRLRRRRDNLAKLERAVRQVERVVASVQLVEKSLEHHEIDFALDAIRETERLLTGEGEEGLIDLRGVRSLEAVTADLNHLRYRVGKAYEARFVQCLLDDLRSHVEKVSSQETLRRFAQSYQREQYHRYISSKQSNKVNLSPQHSSLPPEYAVMSESLRGLLMKHLKGLQRANHVNTAVQAYRDAVIKEAKNLIRRNLPSEGDTDSVMSHTSRVSRSGGIRQSSADKSMALTRALRALGPVDAEDLLVKIYTGVSELIRRLSTQQKMLLDVTMQLGETGVGGMLSPRFEQNGFVNGDSSHPRSRSESDPISMDMISDLISSAVEISQSNIVKVVKVRTEQIARYPPDMLVRYFTLNRLFAQECEAVSVRANSGLQNAVNSQIKEFLTAYQEEHMRTLADGLEKDRWGAKEFEESRQQGLDRILRAATNDPEEWLSLSRLWEIRTSENNTTLISLPPTPSETNGTTAAPTVNGTSTATASAPEKRTHAVIDDQRFILPESGLLVLSELESYLCLVTLLPGFVPDLAQNIADFLRLFNSRTFQLILGAGATRSAGLKSITTKHLAIASQALSIVSCIIPYIRESLRRHASNLPSSSAGAITVDFDKLKRTTQEYQHEIHAKLVGIMSDRARTHSTVMRKMDWDQEWKGDAGRYYMDVLCRETGVLYKVLSKHLPVEQVASIMQPVFRDYEGRMRDGFEGAVVRTEEGKQRMLKDAETFKAKLGGLEGCGEVVEGVFAAARNKVIMAGSDSNGTPVSGKTLSPAPQEQQQQQKQA